MLTIRDLTKSYGPREILGGLTFDVPLNGSIYGIFGPNGAGKTTLFRCLMGLVPFEKGSVEIEGADVTGCPTEDIVRRGVAYMFQESILFHDLSVRDNLTVIAEQLFPGDGIPDLDGILERYGLARVGGNPARTLSGGERKRLEFARCMLIEPKLFLLDEPFSNIDPLMVGEMKQLITEHAARGITFVITDHNLHETIPFVNRVFVLYGGRFLAEGPPAEVVADPTVRGLYLGDYRGT
jgi:lipopolysaccharide export system ATP-binding protein